MKIVAIVQARMSSSRLPGKVLLPLSDKPVLYHIHERLTESRLIDQIVFSTSKEESDNPIYDFCNIQNIPVYRGSLNDVLDRFYKTASEFSADVIIRITGDCPIVDPIIVDAVISGFLAGNYDYYGLGGEFPDGLDCTAFTFKALERAWKEAQLPSEREHVGPYIEKNSEVFKNGSLKLFTGMAEHRWTLDEFEDYELLLKIFEELYIPGKIFFSHDVLKLLERKSELIKINSSIIRNEGYLKSLRKEAKDGKK